MEYFEKNKQFNFDEWETFESDDFSIDFPKDFMTIKNLEENEIIIYHGALPPQLYMILSPLYVKINKEQLRENITRKEAIEIIKNSLKSKEVDFNDIEINELNFLISSFDNPFTNGKIKNIYVFGDYHIYTLFIGAKFVNDMEEVIKKVYSSFKLK
jgi:hypothetical protein